MIAIKGVDTSIGLARSGNNELLYRRMLTRFRDGERPFASRCRALVSDERIHEATDLAHELGSTAGMLGAIDVSSHAALLESALKRGLAPQSLLGFIANVEQSLTPVFAELDRVLPVQA